jgi:hypothetical protein
MNFTVSTELENTLKDLSKSTGHTIENLIIKAIFLLKVVIEANENGKYLAFVDDQGKILQSITGLHQYERKLPKDINS